MTRFLRSLRYRIHRRMAQRLLVCCAWHQKQAAKIRGLWL